MYLCMHAFTFVLFCVVSVRFCCCVYVLCFHVWFVFGSVCVFRTLYFCISVFQYFCLLLVFVFLVTLYFGIYVFLLFLLCLCYFAFCISVFRHSVFVVDVCFVFTLYLCMPERMFSLCVFVFLHCIFVFLHVCIYAFLYFCMFVFLYFSISLFMYFCISVSLYVCMSVFMYSCFPFWFFWSSSFFLLLLSSPKGRAPRLDWSPQPGKRFTWKVDWVWQSRATSFWHHPCKTPFFFNPSPKGGGPMPERVCVKPTQNTTFSTKSHYLFERFATYLK